MAGTASIAGNSGDGAAATSAKLSKPWGVAFDRNGNMFIADAGNHNVRMVKANTGFISTIVGTGTAGTTNASPGVVATQLLNTPQDVKFDASGNLYIASSGSNCIYKVVSPASSGTISVVAGKPGIAGDAGDGGLATSATLNSPNSMAFDASDNLYLFTSNNYSVHRIRKVVVGGKITAYAGATNPTPTNPGAYAGDGGPAIVAGGETHLFKYPYGGAFDAHGFLYVCDKGNSRIRKVGPAK